MILKIAWYATWYFKNWYFGIFLFSKLVLLAIFVFQKELFDKSETFEKQRQPKIPILKIKKIQIFKIPGGIPNNFKNDIQKKEK